MWMLSKVTIPRICNIDPAGGGCGNELHSNGSRYHVAFIAEQVHVVTTGIHEAHAQHIDVRFAIRIVRVIPRYGSLGDNDQAVARVCVPSGAATRLEDVALNMKV